MSAFLDPIDVRLVGPDRWMTLTPVRYNSDVAKRRITVPAEFVTDFASVPRAPLAYLIAAGRARGPALIHDHLYQAPGWDDRDLADAIFSEAMDLDQPELGIYREPGPITFAMWGAVRAFGWIPWQRRRQRGKLLNPIWTATTWPWPEVQAV